MKTTSGQKPTTEQQRRHFKLAISTTSRKLASAWKPEACALGREELRKIVADLLG
jgi:hypothetical protein